MNMHLLTASIFIPHNFAYCNADSIAPPAKTILSIGTFPPLTERQLPGMISTSYVRPLFVFFILPRPFGAC
jgi:hypothetical protein